MTFKETGLKVGVISFMLTLILFITAPHMGDNSPNQGMLFFFGDEMLQKSGFDEAITTPQDSRFNTGLPAQSSTLGIYGIDIGPILAFLSAIPAFIFGLATIFDVAVFGFLNIGWFVGIPGIAIIMVGGLLRLLVYISLVLYMIDIIAAIAGAFLGG